jgi:hypothetical protein
MLENAMRIDHFLRAWLPVLNVVQVVNVTVMSGLSPSV